VKAIIKKILGGNNSQFEIYVDVLNDAGEISFSKTIGINYVQDDPALVLEHVKAAIKTHLEKFEREVASITKSEVEKLLGQEIEL